MKIYWSALMLVCACALFASTEPAAAQATDTDSEEPQSEAAGEQTPTEPQPSPATETTLEEVREWCSPELRQDKGENVGQDADDKPCELQIGSSPRDAGVRSEYYAYDDQGRLSHRWVCSGDDCIVTGLFYDENASSGEQPVEKRTCDAHNIVALEQFSYAPQAEGDEDDSGSRVVETRLYQASNTDESSTTQTVRDQHGEIVEERRFDEDSQTYQPQSRREITYGDDGRIQSVVRHGFGRPMFLDVYTYNEAGQLIRIDYYDANRFQDGEYTIAGRDMDPDASLIYAYDEQGRLQSKTHEGHTRAGHYAVQMPGGSYYEYAYDCGED